jgi:hypothetical protein
MKEQRAGWAYWDLNLETQSVIGIERLEVYKRDSSPEKS